jgi:hypothetical protein
MSPLSLLHATRVTCRGSIRARGLVPNQPNPSRPYGVYTYSDGIVNRGSRCKSPDGTPRLWGPSCHMDVWQVSYIGPCGPDVYISNGLILFDKVAPEYVTLVTGNN